MVATASLVNRYAATTDLLDEWRRYAYRLHLNHIPKFRGRSGMGSNLYS